MGNNKSDFLVGLLIGGALGAAIALLYAPQSGEETREQIKKRSGEFKEHASDAYDKARERAVETTEQLKDRTTSLASTVRDNASQMAARVGDRIRRATPPEDSEATS